eukprot:4240221-Prymnesium_polylepis.1
MRVRGDGRVGQPSSAPHVQGDGCALQRRARARAHSEQALALVFHLRGARTDACQGIRAVSYTHLTLPTICSV